MRPVVKVKLDKRHNMFILDNTVNLKSQANDIDVTERRHDDKPSKPYLCTVCDKRFTSKQYLGIHRRRHTGAFYSCAQCEKCYTFPSALCVHMNVHRGKYKCTVCSKCYQTSYELAAQAKSFKRETF